ncbi:hypothetical protein GCM10010405_57030 [Streptomyces macrosporus]|uniref:Protein kinase domain-containing protein n=2 Tax=Streptomyces macrosporus TaxID=44032 RepID=A0ABP5XUF6_9ACTN
MAPLGTDAPRRLGPYRLYGVIGRGTSGPVHLGRGAARRGGRKRAAAVRALRPELLRDRQVRARLRHDLETIRTRVDDPHPARPLDWELDSEQPWIASEFVPGPSLAHLLDRYGPPPEDVVRALGAALARALAALHAAGVVHGCLRPSSVLVTDDRPRLVDCALTLDPLAEDRGQGADDVFDLGVLLALAASGHHPFAGGVLPSGREGPDLTGVPTALHPPLLACLHKDPCHRPAPGALAACLDPEGTASRPAGEWLPEVWLHTVGVRAAEARELLGWRLFGR